MSTLIKEHLILGEKYKKLTDMYKDLQNENKRLQEKVDSLTKQLELTQVVEKTCLNDETVVECNGDETCFSENESIEEKPKKSKKKKENNSEE